MVKGGGALETLARVRTLVFDKTGTATTGLARIAGIDRYGETTETELLGLAASLDQFSTHPIAAASSARPNAGLALRHGRRHRGGVAIGIAGRVEGCAVRLGSLAFVADDMAADEAVEPHAGGTLRRAARDGAATVFIGLDGGLAGAFVVTDDPA
ncbi:MAG: hypothetical protein R3D25_12800 [Geminicoccaceae bacterium]